MHSSRWREEEGRKGGRKEKKGFEKEIEGRKKQETTTYIKQ
jgi:hypothetical protein